MSTTMAMPATTHALPHAQRLRLMRSTRKVGALLGETPLVLDDSASSSIAVSSPGAHTRSFSTTSTESKRSGRIFTLSRSNSMGVSVATPPAPTPAATSSHAQSAARPLLFLRLPASMVPGVERATVPSPLSPTFGIGLKTPSTPPADGEGQTRRRKMAKLVRTLGENVPPELVFPLATSKGRRRASTLSVPESSLARRRDADLSRRESNASLHAKVPVATAKTEPFSFPSTIPVPGPARRTSCDTIMSSSSPGNASLEHLLPPHAGGMYRKEQGWSGEWAGNVANMDDVVRNLRRLKAK
ncbi:hypothetical protein B0H10DRAFT_1975339 [Mycena sp. CBHHK59/15]|nr:hypothetical protein B0H10DRAFT_1975339 [Mycena sp. CBHHK59/15]